MISRKQAGHVGVAAEGEIDHHTIDRYTLAHAAVGVAMGLIRAPWWVTVAAAVGWELVENPLKRAYPDAFAQKTVDTPDNAITDIAAWILGWAIMRRATDSYPLQLARKHEDTQP